MNRQLPKSHNPNNNKIEYKPLGVEVVLSESVKTYAPPSSVVISTSLRLQLKSNKESCLPNDE